MSTADRSALKFRNHFPLYVSMQSPSHRPKRPRPNSSIFPASFLTRAPLWCARPLARVGVRIPAPISSRGRVFPIRSPQTKRPQRGAVLGPPFRTGRKRGSSRPVGANQAPAEPMVPCRVSEFPSASVSYCNDLELLILGPAPPSALCSLLRAARLGHCAYHRP